MAIRASSGITRREMELALDKVETRLDGKTTQIKDELDIIHGKLEILDVIHGKLETIEQHIIGRKD